LSEEPTLTISKLLKNKTFFNEKIMETLSETEWKGLTEDQQKVMQVRLLFFFFFFFFLPFSILSFFSITYSCSFFKKKDFFNFQPTNTIECCDLFNKLFLSNNSWRKTR